MLRSTFSRELLLLLQYCQHVRDKAGYASRYYLFPHGKNCSLDQHVKIQAKTFVFAFLLLLFMKKLSLSLCRPNLSHILRGFQIVQIEKKYHALIQFDAMFPETGKEKEGIQVVPNSNDSNCRARKQFPYHNLVGPPTISQ